MDCQGRGTKIQFIHYRETLYLWGTFEGGVAPKDEGVSGSQDANRKLWAFISRTEESRKKPRGFSPWRSVT